MNKIIKILLIFLFISNTSFAENNIIDKGYNFIIWDVESVKSIKIPDSYLLDKKYKGTWNTINLLKIKDYKVFSSDNIIKKSKNLYIYIDPSDRTFLWDKDKLFSKEDVKIWKKVIFRSDNLINTGWTFSSTYYRSSILDLFYDKNNIYTQYEQWFWYFNCKEDNKFEIDIVSPENSNYFYSSLAFINPTTFKWEKKDIPKLERKMVEKIIKNSSICKKEENVSYEVNSKQNTLYYKLITWILSI